MKKDIYNYNENNQPHGYWEAYYKDGSELKCNYFNGELKGLYYFFAKEEYIQIYFFL